jgi:hypothetical protein
MTKRFQLVASFPRPFGVVFLVVGVCVACFAVWIWMGKNTCTSLTVRNEDRDVYRAIHVALGLRRQLIVEMLPPGKQVETRLCGGLYEKWFLDYVAPDGSLIGPRFLDEVYLDVPGKPRVEIVFADGKVQELAR